MASVQLDRSDRQQMGHASYYGWHVHRQMADGSRFNPDSDAAASRTLPFGTTVRQAMESTKAAAR